MDCLSTETPMLPLVLTDQGGIRHRRLLTSLASISRMLRQQVEPSLFFRCGHTLNEAGMQS